MVYYNLYLEANKIDQVQIPIYDIIENEASAPCCPEWEMEM